MILDLSNFGASVAAVEDPKPDFTSHRLKQGFYLLEQRVGKELLPYRQKKEISFRLLLFYQYPAFTNQSDSFSLENQGPTLEFFGRFTKKQSIGLKQFQIKIRSNARTCRKYSHLLSKDQQN